MTRAGRAVVAALVIAVVLVGPPLLLVTSIGNPWPPEGVALSAPLTDGAILGALAVVVWLLWAQMTWCLLAELTAALTKDRVLPPVRLTFGVQQHLARQLVSAILFASVAAPLVATLASSGQAAAALTPSSPQVAVSQERPASDGAAAGSGQLDHRTAPRTSLAPATTTVTVMRLDSLWSIAERTLGDGERWNEIADLNVGKTMTDGTTFTAAVPIRPGWQLAVPGSSETLPAGESDSQITVEAGDTLTQIAADRLGAASRYDEIFRASQSITQPDGRHLTNPDVIDVGWTLALPSETRKRPVKQAPQVQAPPTKTTTPSEPTLVPSIPRPTEATTGPDVDSSATTDDHRSAPGLDSRDTNEDGNDAPWMLVGLTGAGALLGGGLHLAVRARRRQQSRQREPGLIPGRIDPSLVAVDKSVWISEPAAVTLTDIDLVLRELAADRVGAGLDLPSVAAVELLADEVSLHLSAAADLVPPWRARDPGALRWSRTLTPSAPQPEKGYPLSRVDPPYPLLVTMGKSEDGATWLINLEELGELLLRGDTSRCLDLARYLVAELALSPWSAQARVTCVGLREEDAVASDRVEFSHADDVERVTADFLGSAVEMAKRAGAVGTSPATGRAGQLDDDVWQAHCLVLLDPRAAGSLSALSELLQGRPNHTGAAAVIVGSEAGVGTHADLAADGCLRIKQFGLRLRAASLTAEEASGCAGLLRCYEESASESAPHDANAEGWEALVDLGGAAREEWTTPRDMASGEEVAKQSLLPAATTEYVESAAVTAEDTARLAPAVAPQLAVEAAAADPTLEQDIDDWFNDACHRPRLVLLGPVSVKAYGVALTKRKPYFTEMLTFLALRRRHGVTAADLAEAFNIEVRKARIYVNTIRDWLGKDPETGALYLPHADKAPAARSTGIAVYQVSEQLLVDTELFRRLRLRGQSHGAAGIADLSRALDLVQGQPFDQLRPGGWSWLLDGERVDHYASAAAADVSLLVASHALERGDLAEARSAAEIGVTAAPDEDATALTMARVLAAEGATGEAAARMVTLRNLPDSEGLPVDLSSRSAEIGKRIDRLS